MSQHPSYLLWTDLETTGLYDGNKPPKLMEAAFVLLPFGDFDINNAQMIIQQTYMLMPNDVKALIPFIQDMHSKNGLIADCQEAHELPATGQYKVIAALREQGVDAKDFAFAGSGIAPFDLPLLREYMSDLYEYAHYAPFDLGTARRALQMLYPDTNLDNPNWSPADSTHRAFEDVVDELNEAQWYSKNFSLVSAFDASYL
jgi:oligoribonuclease (3'-5' exoribonuclease)